MVWTVTDVAIQEPLIQIDKNILNHTVPNQVCNLITSVAVGM